jgi:hypothetical protein
MRTNLLKLAVLFALVVTAASAPIVARGVTPAVGPTFSSIGPLAFAPDGTLFAADRQAATIFALDLSAQKAGTPGTMNVTGIDQKLAALFGTDAAQVAITDLAVEPKSKNSYLSVMRGQGAAAQAALVRVDGGGKLEIVALESVKFTTITLPNPANENTTGRQNPRMQSVTDMALVDGRLFVTGLSNEEFASKFWAVPYPFNASDNGTSVEIYHGNHGAFETRSPVISFVPTKINNQPAFIAGYTCTPLVRFPLSDLKPGAKVMGTTIAELGAGNQPLDMVLYRKDGKEFLLIHNSSRGVMKIATDPFGTADGIKTRIGGTAGVPFEQIGSMTGITQLDLLDATHSIVLQRAEAGLNLTAVILP